MSYVKAGKRIWSYESLKSADSKNTIAQIPSGKLCRNDRASSNNDFQRKPLMNSAHKSSWRRMRVRISYHGDAKRFSYGGKLSDAPISDVGFRAAVRVPKTADRQVDALVETDYYQAGGTEKDLREIVSRRFDRI
ncbi:hypothetical protein FOMG_18166 [Fusarium oxysporum f. sp. melonis 26406]|uniref:Uncharacterized protein n=2 Tax=Fusarium oxysporum TaxID=5507 RepID=W9ZA76_FUSOX|nr:hypothetical protein FOMG_18166 [Fusarium oxysporum f. sp. melonis 26406]